MKNTCEVGELAQPEEAYLTNGTGYFPSKKHGDVTNN